MTIRIRVEDVAQAARLRIFPHIVDKLWLARGNPNPVSQAVEYSEALGERAADSYVCLVVVMSALVAVAVAVVAFAFAGMQTKTLPTNAMVTQLLIFTAMAAVIVVCSFYRFHRVGKRSMPPDAQAQRLCSCLEHLIEWTQGVVEWKEEDIMKQLCEFMQSPSAVKTTEDAALIPFARKIVTLRGVEEVRPALEDPHREACYKRMVSVEEENLITELRARYIELQLLDLVRDFGYGRYIDLAKKEKEANVVIAN